MLGAQRLDGGDPLANRLMAKTGGLGEDEDREPGRNCLRGDGGID